MNEKMDESDKTFLKSLQRSLITIPPRAKIHEETPTNSPTHTPEEYPMGFNDNNGNNKILDDINTATMVDDEDFSNNNNNIII